MEFTVVVTREEGVYNVSVPSLPGCHTWGKTKQAALKNAKEAIELYIESLTAAGEPIPAEESLHRVRVE
ncbi:MAG: type II toxin-antitoxin system HicB family antitoxin [Planctomycetes bacterium]|nr:type II toxin-antitoxin system HicB family antitoxin [Planctomycetota bacterium]